MMAPLLAMLGQISAAQILTRAQVTSVVRNAAGGFQIACGDGRAATVDQVVFASSGPPTLQLLQNMQGMPAQISALQNIVFRDARLALHTDPIYASPDSKVWSFLNSGIHGGFCEASMWMGDVINSAPQETAARVWKSWDTHRLVQPQQILAEAHFRHMLPTPATLAAQVALLSLQGEDSVWFAGGYTRPYDSQETALISALGVAQGLGAASERVRLLIQP
jgi:predicted NAD/FAD-binding protein